jgi:hypothetical protein
VYPRGKAPAAPRPKDFKWEAFEQSISLPTLPHNFGHGLLYHDWGMNGNGPDNSVAPGFPGAGDCVCAGAVNEVKMINRVVTGKDLPLTGKEAIAMYSDITGYVLANRGPDNGTDMGEAAEYRRLTGLADATGKRHKIGAWIRLRPGDFEQMLMATYIFMAVGIGFRFPVSAWHQFVAGEPWDYDPLLDNTIDGGHYVSRVGVKRVVSWGRALEMTKAFYEQFNDETIVYVTPEQLRITTAKDVHGFDMEKLNALLATVGH